MSGKAAKMGSLAIDDLQDHVSSSANDTGTRLTIDTPLTQGRSPDVPGMLTLRGVIEDYQTDKVRRIRSSGSAHQLKPAY
jgi:hypothetical protein